MYLSSEFMCWKKTAYEILSALVARELCIRDSYEPMNLWTYEPMNLWTYEPMNLWNLWTYEPMNLWTYEPMNLWTYEPMNLWTYETYEPMNLWTYEPMKPMNFAYKTAGFLMIFYSIPMNLWTSLFYTYEYAVDNCCITPCRLYTL